MVLLDVLQTELVIGATQDLDVSSVASLLKYLIILLMTVIIGLASAIVYLYKTSSSETKQRNTEMIELVKSVNKSMSDTAQALTNLESNERNTAHLKERVAILTELLSRHISENSDFKDTLSTKLSALLDSQSKEILGDVKDYLRTKD
jgi:gas vesicle protein